VKSTVAVAFLCVTGLMLAACGGGGGGASSPVISGTEILTNTGAASGNVPCNGDYGAATFEDLGTGTVVGVTDQNGSLIGSGQLRAGMSSTANGGECVWRFKVSVPATATSYTIQVGQRPPMTFSQTDLAGNQWAATLTVDGSNG
jgi:hypothetical protein